MSTVQPSTHSWRFRFGIRWVLIAITLACVLFARIGWYQRTVHERDRCYASIEEMLRSLEKRRPTEMTPGQWNNAVVWTTGGLLPNSAIFHTADLRDIQQLERELQVKLNGRVDFNTILWIWDRIALLCETGQLYNERWRKQMIEDSSLEGSKRTWLG
jgi:hypothetical protein